MGEITLNVDAYFNEEESQAAANDFFNAAKEFSINDLRNYCLKRFECELYDGPFQPAFEDICFINNMLTVQVIRSSMSEGFADFITFMKCLMPSHLIIEVYADGGLSSRKNGYINGSSVSHKEVLASLSELSSDMNSHVAILSTKKDKIFEAIDKGGNIDNLKINGRPALFCVSKETCIKLIELGANTNVRLPCRDDYNREKGHYLVHWSIYSNSTPSVFKKLIEYKVDLSVTTPTNETCMHLAAYKGKRMFIKTLLEHGLDINALDVNGNSPFMRAIYSKSIKLLDFMIKNGANPKLTNNEGNTAYDICRLNSYFKNNLEFLSEVAKRCN